MSHPLIIMLSGYMGSGKDTVGKLLKGHGFIRYAFADIMKDEVARLYKIDRSSLDTVAGKESKAMLSDGKATTVRRILIDHAQGQRREDIHHWARRTLDRILGSGHERIVITDWRFPSEWDFLCRNTAGKVVTWRVERYEAPPLIDPTEIALDTFPFDDIILNQGTVEELRETIVPMLESLGLGLNSSFSTATIDECVTRVLPHSEQCATHTE